nr:immunoglobulin heavy chain junction region [Mus musculus]
CIGDDGYYW